MRAWRHETERLDISEKVILRELRIVRAHSPTDHEVGFPIGVALVLPELLVKIKGDVPGLMPLGALDALAGDDDEVVWIIGCLIPRRATAEDHEVAYLIFRIPPNEPVEPGYKGTIVERI